MRNYKRLFVILLSVLLTYPLCAQTNEMVIKTNKPGAEIQPTMYGLFFEDINYAADRLMGWKP